MKEVVVVGLLDGVRVVETGVLMGMDNLGRLLGDEGAEVIKVESPDIGPALTFGDISDDPHLRARNMVITEDHPVVGSFQTLGNPLRLDGATFAPLSAPAHGQHTDEILEEFGYDASMRTSLRRSGVIG